MSAFSPPAILVSLHSRVKITSVLKNIIIGTVHLLLINGERAVDLVLMFEPRIFHNYSSSETQSRQGQSFNPFTPKI